MFNANILLVSGIGAVFIGLGALVIGLVIGFILTKIVNTKKIGNSKTTAAKIIEEAYAEAKTVKKEAVLEAKEEIHKMRDEFEKEAKDRKLELAKAEDRLVQKEQFIDKKDLFLEKKQEEIDKAKLVLQEKEAQLDVLLKAQTELKNQVEQKLQEISGMKKEEAKQTLINSMVEEARKDSVKIIAQMQQDAEEEGTKLAKNIVANAIQKCATDLTAEMTVSSVQIPNEEMKGRIIGREGRNIRAIEQATGVDLIIDDTPDAITVSCFEPVRREIARLSLEKLILDGRIHPARIEEVVEKVTKDLDVIIKQAGEAAVTETEVFGMHPELVKVLGRLKYRTSYGQNVLRHSIETSFIAGLLAAELGADIKIAKRGGLLHDIGKALDHEIEGDHVSIGVDLARRYKESPAVIHCIEAHHFGVEFNSLEAIIVQVADAISSSRPGARRESLETYIKRLQKLEEISTSFTGVKKAFAIQAGREIRVMVKPEELDDAESKVLALDIAKKIEQEMQYPGQIKVHVIRESRFTEVAK
ncbi:MAG: ribonuclease Y [Christensenellales bacterium]|jgi:ribonuclease Y